MRTRKTLLIGFTAACAITATALFLKTDEKQTLRAESKGCVFMTLFGEESSDSAFIYKTPEKVMTSVERGLQWMATAQQANGGLGRRRTRTPGHT